MFSEVKKNFGFGCMRLPMKGEEVDTKEFTKMVDTFLANGFNYFDTASGYIDGKSEKALKECLTDRYSRDKYVLANKLSDPFIEKNEDIRPFFEKQLKACGVEYFDFYLMHAQNKTIYEKYTKIKAYETAYEFKKEGKIKHLGLSFHDSAEVLDKILSEHPEIEFVQIQFNYVDYNDPFVQSKKVYDVCVKYNKPVIVMEPVKGGSLLRLKPEAKKIFDDLNGGSYASYAIRFVAGFSQVFMTLSGMSNMEQIEDNVAFMKDFKPLNDRELQAVNKVCEIFNSCGVVPCTGCRYCTAGCPKKLKIPEIFACYNTVKQFDNWDAKYFYKMHAEGGKSAGDCIKCGACEKICPQHLKIRDLLKEVSEVFDKD